MTHMPTFKFQSKCLNDKNVITSMHSNTLNTSNALFLNNKRERSKENKYLCLNCNCQLLPCLNTLLYENMNCNRIKILKEEPYSSSNAFSQSHLNSIFEGLCNECAFKQLVSAANYSSFEDKELYLNQISQLPNQANNQYDIMINLLNLFPFLLDSLQSFNRIIIKILHNSMEILNKVKYKIIQNQQINNLSQDIITTQNEMIQLYTRLIENINFYQNIMNAFRRLLSFSHKTEDSLNTLKTIQQLGIENSCVTNYTIKEQIIIINELINQSMLSSKENNFQIQEPEVNFNISNINSTLHHHQHQPKNIFPQFQKRELNNHHQYPQGDIYYTPNTALDYNQCYNAFNYIKVDKANNTIPSVNYNHNSNQCLSDNYLQHKPVDNNSDIHYSLLKEPISFTQHNSIVHNPIITSNTKSLKPLTNSINFLLQSANNNQIQENEVNNKSNQTSHSPEKMNNDSIKNNKSQSLILNIFNEIAKNYKTKSEHKKKSAQ